MQQGLPAVLAFAGWWYNPCGRAAELPGGALETPSREGPDTRMPTYVYQCRACSEQTELVQKMTDPPLTVCPACGGEVRKLLFAPGIVFKGPGFHVNDYRKPEPGRNGGSNGSEKSGTESESSARKTEPAAV